MTSVPTPSADPTASPEPAGGPAPAPRPKARRTNTAAGWLRVHSPAEQAQLRRFLLRWTRPGCGLVGMFALTLSLWTWSVWHPHPLLWLLGALLTPWTTPVAGVALGLVLGQAAVLRRGVGFVLGLGLLAGMLGWGVGWIWQQSGSQAPMALAGWVGPDMIAFTATLVTAVWATVLLARRRAAALLPGVVLTWTIAGPVFWAGVTLAIGDTRSLGWALLAFATHLFWAWVLSSVVLIALGLYPPSWAGYTLLFVFFVLAAGLFVPYAQADLARRVADERVAAPPPLGPSAASMTGPTQPQPASGLAPTPTPSVAPTPTPTLTPTPSALPTPTPTPTSATAVATYTVVWPTATMSPTPTPVYAAVRAPARYTGIYVREGPGFTSPAFTGLANGTLVIVLPEQAEADDLLWVKVRFEEFGRWKEGWVLYSLLEFVTPTPTPLD